MSYQWDEAVARQRIAAAAPGAEPTWYYVVRTAFGGGGIVSKHRALPRACKAAEVARNRGLDCGAVADFEYPALRAVGDIGNGVGGAGDLARKEA